MIPKDIISRVSHETSLPEDIIEKVYKTFWFFIKQNIECLPLKENLSKEEFDKLNTNFNIPSLGKLVCTYDKYIKTKKRINKINSYVKDKENKTNVHFNSDNNE